MLSIIRMAILFLIVLAAGCAPKPLSPTAPGPIPETPGQLAFRDAERAFEKGLTLEALEGYQTFLREAGEDPAADEALFKIGTIFRLSGRDQDALTVFSRMMREFPKSLRAADAMLEILDILYRGGQFNAVVASGAAYTESTDPTLRRTPIFIIVADAYAALDDDLNATRFTYRAWNTASGEESNVLWNRLSASIGQLGAGDIEQLLSEMRNPRLIGLLLYRLGMQRIADEKYDDAMDALKAFVNRFPEHPDRQDAEEMIRFLAERQRFTPFTVGILLPLTGAYAIYGQRALNGIELALSQVNGTAGEVPFQMVIEDSRSDSDAAATAVAELDRRKVGVILGPMSASEAAAENAQARGIPMIVFTGREGIPDIGAYVFRNFITPTMQVRSLVSFAVDELRVRRFAILYPDEKYGRYYMNLFWDQVVERGAVVNGAEAYDPEGTDFADPVKKLGGIFYEKPRDLKIKAIPRLDSSGSDFLVEPSARNRKAIADPLERISGLPLDRDVIDHLGRRSPDSDDRWHPIVDFDAVFIPDASKKAGMVIPQLAYYDIHDVYLLGTNLWNSDTLLKMAGEYMKNALIVDGFFVESQSPPIKAFVAAFQRAFDRVPGIVEALAYDSAMMVFQTMRRTATDSRRELKQRLLRIDDFSGVCGRTGFEPSGEADKTLQVLRISRGRFVPVQPAAAHE
ncbi:MAG: penicillin-binding protein activator [Desulfosarcina sp.]